MFQQLARQKCKGYGHIKLISAVWSELVGRRHCVVGSELAGRRRPGRRVPRPLRPGPARPGSCATWSGLSTSSSPPLAAR